MAARSEERRVGKECRSRCDWSSDVCSSDLSGTLARRRRARRAVPAPTRGGPGPALSRTADRHGGKYAWGVSALYAWLGRHPRLVDGTLALLLALLGLPTVLSPGGPLVVLMPVALVMIVAVVFRRRNPPAAFALAVAAGAVQVLTASRPIG